ncbi:MAG: HgcAB-associated protein [bacterium]|nr:HgcAB-associated protein [bacterium]
MKGEKSNCGCGEGILSCCQVEAILTVDERGQMVLPKEVRTKANIQTGDKLALISYTQGDQVCCFSLVKVEALSGMVKNFLGPIMKDVMG